MGYYYFCQVKSGCNQSYSASYNQHPQSFPLHESLLVHPVSGQCLQGSTEPCLLFIKHAKMGGEGYVGWISHCSIFLYLNGNTTELSPLMSADQCLHNNYSLYTWKRLFTFLPCAGLGSVSLIFVHKSSHFNHFSVFSLDTFHFSPHSSFMNIGKEERNNNNKII